MMAMVTDASLPGLPPHPQIDVMVDLRLNRSSADWINKAENALVDVRSTCAHSSERGYGLNSRGLEEGGREGGEAEGVKVLPLA